MRVMDIEFKNDRDYFGGSRRREIKRSSTLYSKYSKPWWNTEQVELDKMKGYGIMIFKGQGSMKLTESAKPPETVEESVPKASLESAQPTTASLEKTAGFAANSNGATIAVILTGTAVPFPDSQSFSHDISINQDNTVFSVQSTGRYYISYSINLVEAQMLGARLMVNGEAVKASTIEPINAMNTFRAEVMLELTEESSISLEIFGILGVAILQSGVGATITLLKLD